MTPEQFCYWLRGHVDLAKGSGLDAEQMAEVRKHLDLVFVNVTGNPDLVAAIDDALKRRPPLPERTWPIASTRPRTYC